MCFDVPKVVRSPGCDHGHDEESRNGRDMKIDILGDYIRTPEWFRGLLDIYQSTGGIPEPPRRLMGLMGPSGRRGEAAKGQPRPPPPQVRIGQGGGAAPPLSFPPLSPSLSSPTLTWKGGVLLPVGVGFLMGRAKGGRPPPPPPLLYIQGGRHPLETQQLIHWIS